ncbi:Hypothetical predicted protein, partial [Pelobates cultripes]
RESDPESEAPARASNETPDSDTVSSPLSFLPPKPDPTSLADIGAELRTITAMMVTNTDLQTLSTNLHEAIRAEVSVLKIEVMAQEARICTLGGTLQNIEIDTRADTTAISRQGDMLLTIVRQVNDFDNRTRRVNIRVRGVPEAQDGEDAEEVLSSLFRHILRNEASNNFQFDQAHRATRLRMQDGPPRDLLFYLLQLKDRIMLKACSRSHWAFRGADVKRSIPYHLRSKEGFKADHNGPVGVECLL